jgi:hypothetical protein
MTPAGPARPAGGKTLNKPHSGHRYGEPTRLRRMDRSSDGYGYPNVRVSPLMVTWVPGTAEFTVTSLKESPVLVKT